MHTFKNIKYNFFTGKFYRHGRVIGSEYKNKCGSRYVNVFSGSKTFKAHRLAWFVFYGRWPDGDIDHINGNGLDNRIYNLRDVSKSTNQKNTRRSRRNKSGLSGVLWRGNLGKYEVTATSGKTKYSLGYYEDIFSAACARKSFNSKNGFTLRHGV